MIENFIIVPKYFAPFVLFEKVSNCKTTFEFHFTIYPLKLLQHNFVREIGIVIVVVFLILNGDQASGKKLFGTCGHVLVKQLPLLLIPIFKKPTSKKLFGCILDVPKVTQLQFYESSVCTICILIVPHSIVGCNHKFGSIFKRNGNRMRAFFLGPNIARNVGVERIEVEAW
jgi:hypothetical protein